MDNVFNYTVVTSALIKAVRTATGYLLIESNSAGEQPPYPFCSYTITSPKIDVEREIENAQFEIVVSLTWHGTSSVGVLNLAKTTESYFKSTKGRDELGTKGIVVVDVTLDGSRDDFLSIDYERKAGLDVHLRVRETFIDDTEPIRDINIKNGGNN